MRYKRTILIVLITNLLTLILISILLYYLGPREIIVYQDIVFGTSVTEDYRMGKLAEISTKETKASKWAEHNTAAGVHSRLIESVISTRAVFELSWTYLLKDVQHTNTIQRIYDGKIPEHLKVFILKDYQTKVFHSLISVDVNYRDIILQYAMLADVPDRIYAGKWIPELEKQLLARYEETVYKLSNSDIDFLKEFVKKYQLITAFPYSTKKSPYSSEEVVKKLLIDYEQTIKSMLPNINSIPTELVSTTVKKFGKKLDDLTSRKVQ